MSRSHVISLILKRHVLELPITSLLIYSPLRSPKSEWQTRPLRCFLLKRRVFLESCLRSPSVASCLQHFGQSTPVFPLQDQVCTQTKQHSHEINKPRGEKESTVRVNVSVCYIATYIHTSATSQHELFLVNGNLPFHSDGKTTVFTSTANYRTTFAPFFSDNNSQ